MLAAFRAKQFDKVGKVVGKRIKVAQRITINKWNFLTPKSRAYFKDLAHDLLKAAYKENYSPIGQKYKRGN
ncbi:MAG: hypothetical protein ABI970_15555 [Chloroflexota bacterium]